MKPESELPETPTGRKPAADAFASYYDQRHSGAFAAEPLDQATGYGLLLAHRLDWVIRHLDLKPDTLLDAGCGKGRYLSIWSEMFPQCRISGCDLSRVAIEYARRQAPYAELEVSTQDHLPFPSGRFNLAVSVEVIEHIPAPALFVRELWRVLKPSGLCVLTTPCANRYSLYWFCAHLRPGGRIRTPYGIRWYVDDPCHLRRVTSDQLARCFEGNGFELRRFYFWQHLFAQLDSRYGRYFRQPGKRFSAIRRRLRFLVPGFDALSNLEWALCKHWPNGAGMIGVFQKPSEAGPPPEAQTDYRAVT